MKEIYLQAYGNLTDILGKESLILSEITDTKELIAQLEMLYPSLNGLTYRISINNRLISQVEMLENGDKIDLLPPFSGG